MSSDFDRQLAVLAEIRDMMRTGLKMTVTHVHDAALAARLDTIINKETAMAGELATLTQEVSETRTAVGSAIALIQGLKARLDEAIASGNPAALKALSDSLDADQQALAAAILANMPAPVTPTVIALPDATLGAPYSATLDPISGAAPFTNALVSGALPDGLVLDSSAPVISGTPERVGSFAFVVSITDSDPLTPDVQRSYTINVA